jgi:glucose dehydrogenase/plastocyanin
MPRQLLLLGLGSFLIVAMIACSGDEGDEGPPASIPDVPSEVSANSDAWPLPNKDYANSRNASDSTITSDNVDELGVAWTFEIPGASAFGSAASNPLVIDDTVYFQDLASNVFAIDLETGEVQWEQRYDELVVGPNGPAVGYDKLFIAKSVHEFAALDLENGDELWSVELDGPTGSIQPSVYGGKVYATTIAGAIAQDGGDEELAVRGYAGGTSGIIYGIDQADGAIDWQFQVVEEGFWGNEEVNSGGGVWYPPAIDQQSGLTFWGTGNPAPFPGIEGFPNGSSRPGDNLYTASALAIDHRTGELVWYNQVKPHDLFDLDFQAPQVLATAEIDGQQRDIVIGSGKLGRVLAFDRSNGDVLWETPVGEHMNDELDAVPEGESVTVLPGVYGGVETPMAVSDGVIYVPVVNLETTYSATGGDAEDGTEALQNAEATIDIPSGTGELVAIDISTGDILWQSGLPAVNFGGATVVGDLVFTATFDGMIYAFDRESGEEVWTYQAPSGINAWPAVSGDTIIYPAGAGDRPLLIAFRIGAEGDIAPPQGSPSPDDGDDTTPEGTPATDGGSRLRTVTTEGLTFEPDELTAAAGVDVTVEYLNDTNIPHNIHFFAGSGTDAETLGATDVRTGPDDLQTVSFSTPDEPGEYLFLCDVHPAQMRGVLRVE